MARPGDMLHVDVKKLVKIGLPGEKEHSSVAFLQRARDWYRRHGIESSAS